MCSFFQVCTGRGKKRASQQNNTPEAIANGSMVLINGEDDFYIGKSSAKNGEMLTVILYQGDLNGTWQPDRNGANEDMLKNVDVTSIKSNHIFHLTQAGKLPSNIRLILKHYY